MQPDLFAQVYQTKCAFSIYCDKFGHSPKIQRNNNIKKIGEWNIEMYSRQYYVGAHNIKAIKVIKAYKAIVLNGRKHEKLKHSMKVWLLVISGM